VYIEELSRYIDREIYPQVVKLQREIDQSGGSPKLVNRLGVLYARYGLIDKAEQEFNKVLAQRKDYVPTLLNLGNIYYLNGEYDQAMSYYERASNEDPDNAKAVLCVARVNHEMENYGTVRKQYDKLKKLDPELATRFAYLDLKGEEAVRAAEAAKIKEAVVWAE
jgi:tetratricopeptide (TPR) repeat protein